MNPPRGRRLGAPLSPQQSQVLSLIANGYGPKEIFTVVGIMPSTTHVVMANVREKLGAASNPHAITIAYRRGLLK